MSDDEAAPPVTEEAANASAAATPPGETTDVPVTPSTGAPIGAQTSEPIAPALGTNGEPPIPIRSSLRSPWSSRISLLLVAALVGGLAGHFSA